MRFPIFTENWAEISLRKCCLSLEYGLNVQAIPFDGINKYIRITDIDDETNKYNNSNLTSPKGKLNDKYLVMENDILLTRTGASTGKPYIYDKKDGKLYFAGFLIRARINTTYNSKFIFYQLLTEKYKRWVQIMSTRSGQPGINSNEYGHFKFNIPKDIEQAKIATFLTFIDERIETQSKIIKEYKSLKKAIINQLIFKNPKLNQRIKLSDFATLKNGYAFKSSSYCENGIFNILTISNVQGDRYIDLSNCNKIVKIPKDIQQHQILKCNDILISLTGNVGRVSIVNVQNCLLNQRVGVLIFKNDKIKKYVYHVISSIQFEKKMILKGQGAAQKNIGNDDVESFKIPFSNDYNYLDKLVSLLELLDDKIAIETSIINDYLSQKKYLLANMFI